MLFEIWFEPIVGALERSASGWQKIKEKKSGRLWIPDTFLIANLACFKRIDKTKKKKEKAYQHWRVKQRPDSPVVALSFAAFSSTIQF